jgi:hypothetical protein
MRPIMLALFLLLAGCSSKQEAAMPQNHANAVEEASENAAANAVAGGNALAPAESADPVIYCQAVSAELAQSQCDLVGKQVASLKAGIGKLVTPPAMRRGDSAIVNFAITPKAAEVVAGRSPASEPLAPGQISTELDIRIGRIMSATLEGAAFEVAPAGEQVRDLGASSRANWNWRITAKQGGNQPLYLTVRVKAVGRDGKPLELDLYQESREVTIRVTIWQWLEDVLTGFTSLFQTTEGAFKALAATLAALGAVVLAWRKIVAGRAGANDQDEAQG